MHFAKSFYLVLLLLLLHIVVYLFLFTYSLLQIIGWFVIMEAGVGAGGGMAYFLNDRVCTGENEEARRVVLEIGGTIWFANHA